MLRRCSDPKNENWSSYGGRGIDVCARWRADFWSFYEDMGPRPSAAHSLDRIDNEWHYQPGNCRWATSSIQHSNRTSRYRESRGSVRFTMDGETRCVSAWARWAGVSQQSLRNGLRRGLSIAAAIDEAKSAARRRVA